MAFTPSLHVQLFVTLIYGVVIVGATWCNYAKWSSVHISMRFTVGNCERQAYCFALSISGLIACPMFGPNRHKHLQTTVWRLSCIYDYTWYQLITYVYHVLSCVIINSANWCSSLSLHFGAPKDMELIWLCVLAPPATKRATVNSLLRRTDATAMTCAQLMPVRWQMLEQLADAHGITWVPHKYHLAITWPSDTTCALNLCRAPRKISESTLMLERPRDFSKVAGQLSIRCRWLKQIEIGSSKQALETPWDLDIAGVYVLKPSPGIYEEFVKNATWCRTWCYFYHSYSCAFGPGHTSFPIRKHQNSIK